MRNFINIVENSLERLLPKNTDFDNIYDVFMNMNDQDFTEDELFTEIDNVCSIIENGAIVYRVLLVDSLKEVDFANIGVHWTYDKDFVIKGHMYGMDEELTRNFIVFETFVSKNEVDILPSLLTNFTEAFYDSEITLKENINISIRVSGETETFYAKTGQNKDRQILLDRL